MAKRLQTPTNKLPQTKTIQLREYQDKDLDWVLSGLIDIHETEQDPLNALNIANDFQEQLTEWLKNLTSHPATLLIIAEQNNQSCGFILGMIELQANSFTTYTHHGLIQAIWIKDRYRRKGIASMLVKEMLNSFNEHQIPYCDIAYTPTNKTSIQFWEKMEFIPAQITARRFLHST